MTPPKTATGDADDPLVGTSLLGKLRVVRRIGAGGNGTVYEVEHLLTHHRRALKVLKPERSISSEAVARLVREAGVGGSIESPALVQTYDVGRLPDGATYLLMELLTGLSFRALIDQQGKLSPTRAAALLAAACEGLAPVHAAGVVHRDLKPDNLFLAVAPGGEEQVKILDFGLMKFTGGAGDSFGALTHAGAFAGTPGYMAPEQLDGRAVDARTDVFALGVVLHEAVHGHNPRAARSATEALAGLGRAESPQQAGPEIGRGAGVAAVIDRATRRAPEERYPSVEALREDLLAIVAGRPPSAEGEPRAEGEPSAEGERAAGASARTEGAHPPAGEARERAPGGSADPISASRFLRERYELVGALKSGAMGAVYEVIHRETRRRRALKVMLPRLVALEQLRARFKLEATITADIESEHLVETFDAGVDPDTDRPFLVMELLKGTELGALLGERGALPPAEVLTLLGQAAIALDKTHAAGIVHRDLKPDNLFVTRRDDGSARLKILDFGIAKILAESARGAGETAPSLGTPLYMAPEQIEGSVGPPADRYALGQIAFTLLTGQAYWADEARAGLLSLFSRLAQGAKEPATARAARRGTALPPAFDAWFERATAVDPRLRFAQCGVMITALAEALAELPPTPPAAPRGGRAAAFSPRPRWLAGAFALAAGSVGALLWLSSRSMGDVRPAPISQETRDLRAPASASALDLSPSGPAASAAASPEGSTAGAGASASAMARITAPRPSASIPVPASARSAPPRSSARPLDDGIF